jgi:hypothetical protein
MTAMAETDVQRSVLVSGKVVVAAMFGFGLLLTAALYGYWELHTRPFRPLQEALAEAVPGSSPRVIGGKHKSHQPGSPNRLRIILRVDYDPLLDENVPRRDALARTIVRLTRTHHDVSPYQLIELHLEHRIPERPPLVWSSTRTPEEWDQFVAEQGTEGSSS